MCRASNHLPDHVVKLGHHGRGDGVRCIRTPCSDAVVCAAVAARRRRTGGAAVDAAPGEVGGASALPSADASDRVPSAARRRDGGGYRRPGRSAPGPAGRMRRLRHEYDSAHETKCVCQEFMRVCHTTHVRQSRNRSVEYKQSTRMGCPK